MFSALMLKGFSDFSERKKKKKGKKPIGLFVLLSLKVGSIVWRVKPASISVDFPWLLLSS